MSSFLQRRRLRKQVKHALFEARHARHMQEDVAATEAVAALNEAQTALEQAWQDRSWDRLPSIVDVVLARSGALWPERRFPRLRENFEVLVVAVAVAMGFRTYFVQPFKIPTGSMQPTLYGISMQPPPQWKWLSHQPLSWLNLALFGERPVTIRMPISGRVHLLRIGPAQNLPLGRNARGGIRQRMLETQYEAQYITIGETRILLPIPTAFEHRFSEGQVLQQDDVLARGALRSGDHIFVNKVIYNLSRPQRGQVVVFDTAHIHFSGINTNAFYIKRLTGLPGEHIAIRDRHLVVNGNRITEPYPFRRLLEDPGYRGYLTDLLPPHVALGNPEHELGLGPQEYLMLGDNTAHSLDGRFFGAVREQDLLGPAFMVYWPLGRRWGRIR